MCPCKALQYPVYPVLSPPPPRLSLRLFLTCIMAGASERARVRGWMYREKGWSHCTVRCWKAARISSFPSPLFLSLYPIGGVIPPSASQGCHRPMIKQRNIPPPPPHTLAFLQPVIEIDWHQLKLPDCLKPWCTQCVFSTPFCQLRHFLVS